MNAVPSHVIAVLFDQLPHIADLRAVCPGQIIEQFELPEGPARIPFGGEGLLTVWNENTGECARIDFQPFPWPDEPGESPPILAAAALGFYGKDTEPRALSRAVQHASHWLEAVEEIPRHTAFVRIILLQAGQGENRPPHSPAREALDWMLRAAASILRLPGAVAAFNPGGEVLLPASYLDEELAAAAAENRIPASALCGLRMWNNGEWFLLDLAGMRQLGLPDPEYVGESRLQNQGDVAARLLSLCCYLADHGDVIETGHTLDGPDGELWRALRCGRGLAPPSRPVLRLSMESSPPPPPAFNPREAEEIEAQESEEGKMAAVFSQMIRSIDAELNAWRSAEPARRTALRRFSVAPAFSVLCRLSGKNKSPVNGADLINRGVMIPVFGVISSPADLPVRPSLVVGSFDPGNEASVQAAFIAGRLSELYGEEKPEDPTDRMLQKIVNDDAYRPGHRVRIPEPAADGFEIYVFCAALIPDDLSREDQALIHTVLTIPGSDPAPLLHIPRSVLAGGRPPALNPGDLRKFHQQGGGCLGKAGLIVGLLATLGISVFSADWSRNNEARSERPDEILTEKVLEKPRTLKSEQESQGAR